MVKILNEGLYGKVLFKCSKCNAYLKLMKRNVTKIGQSIVFLGHINVLSVKISASLIRVVARNNF
jgi:transcriptional regulator of acetoin/glycerol metabolism